MIAKHVMNIHMNRPNLNGDENGNAIGEIDLDKMKSYIAYCKRCIYIQTAERPLIFLNLANVLPGYPRKPKRCSVVISFH